MKWVLAAAALALASAAFAGEVGQVKKAQGSAVIERDGQRIPVTPGMGINESDTILTGADGAVGITFLDNSLLSAGPNSELVIDHYSFDTTTHEGRFDASLKRGTIAAVSGKMVKQTPGTMRIHTPASIMGVRGTEFIVKVTPRD